MACRRPGRQIRTAAARALRRSRRWIEVRLGSASSMAKASAAVGGAEICATPDASGSGIFKSLIVVYTCDCDIRNISEVRASIQGSNVDIE